jgi:hypothetical protein
MAERKDDEKRRLVVPTKFHHIQSTHNSRFRFSGHLGTKRTYYRLSSKYYWKGLHHDVVKWINSCNSCNTRKGDPSNLIEKYRPPVVTQAWELVASDIVGPFPKTKNNNILFAVYGLLTKSSSN